MTTRTLAPSLLIAGMIALTAPAAMASDELAGALFGAGAGAVLGHIVGGNEGAVVGGLFGAIAGATIAHDDHRPAAVPPPRHGAYVPAPAGYYAPAPGWGRPYPVHTHWRHEHDGRWDRKRDDWRERGPDRQAWNPGRGPRRDDPRDGRNW
jgi:hypothetical protein